MELFENGVDSMSEALSERSYLKDTIYSEVYFMLYVVILCNEK